MNYGEATVQSAEGPTKRLFALSGNRCNFPECQVPIIETVGEVGLCCYDKNSTRIPVALVSCDLYVGK